MPFLPAPAGVLRATGDALPPPLRRFDGKPGDTLASPFAEPPVAIAFPPDRSDVEVADREAPLVLKAEGGALPLTWLADGAPIPSAPHRRDVTWTPTGEGFVKFSVIDAKGRVDRVTVRLRQP